MNLKYIMAFGRALEDLQLNLCKGEAWLDLAFEPPYAGIYSEVCVTILPHIITKHLASGE